MKLLLLLAFVASAYSAYFEPGECLVDVCFLLDDSDFTPDEWQALLDYLKNIVAWWRFGVDAKQVAIKEFGESTDFFSIELTEFNGNNWGMFFEISSGRMDQDNRTTDNRRSLTEAYAGCFVEGDRELADNVVIVIKRDWKQSDVEETDILLTNNVDINTIGIFHVDLRRPEFIIKNTFAELPQVVNNIVETHVCEEQVRGCQVRNGVNVSTFDDADLLIEDEQKTLITLWDDGSEDVCKFRVRAVTNRDCIHDPTKNYPMFVDWIGFSYDFSTNTKDGFKYNFLITQMTNPRVRKRGENMAPNSYITTFPYEETLSDGKRKIKIDRWQNDNGTRVKFMIRSECNYAVDWYPFLRYSQLEVFVRARNVTGEMQGICGNSDGEDLNDWKDCDGNAVSPSDEDAKQQISQSCMQGRNQGQKTPGCAKK